MPAIDEYRDPNSKARNTIAETFNGEMKNRALWFDQIREYYNGDQPASLDVKEGEIDDNTVINMVKQAADRTVAFLLPEMPKFEIDPNVSEETDDEAWVRQMWEANGGIEFLQEVGYVGEFSGHNFIRIMPPDPKQGDQYPQLISLDPKAVQIWWKAGDMRRTVFYEVRWSVITDIATDDYILDFVNNGRSWTIYEYKNEGTTSGIWKLTNTQQWLLPLPPIVEWKHLPNPRSRYGKGGFDKSQLQLNDQINNVASENNRIVRYHAGPKTVATGTNADGISATSVDTLWAVESPDAKVYNLEMKSDLVASMAHMHTLIKAFLAESRVVILEGTVKDLQRVTNAGVRTVFIDMLSKLVVLRWNYGRAMAKISQVAAAVAKRGNEVIPDVVYSDPLPTDETEVVNVLMLERGMNIVSRQTVATKRGYDWDAELSKMEAEQKNQLFAPPAPAPAAGGKPGQPGQPNKPGQPGLKPEPGSTSNGVKNG